MARWEILFVLGLWSSACGIYFIQYDGGLDLQLWMLLLVIQSLPYSAAIIMALNSGIPELPAYHNQNKDELGVKEV